MNGTPQALPIEGARKRRGSRGAFKPTREGLISAERKFAAAQAAVKVAIIGPDLRDVNEPLLPAVAAIERALSIYVACVRLEAPKKYLAAALNTSPRRVRSACAFVEAWRGAPVISDALARVEQALPGAM